jgi:hypothetical protein
MSITCQITRLIRVAFLIKAFDDRNYTNSERCENGNSFYYFKVKDYPNIFVGSSQISSQLPVTIIGDTVKISFDVDLEEVIDVSSFENINLKVSFRIEL